MRVDRRAGEQTLIAILCALFFLFTAGCSSLSLPEDQRPAVEKRGETGIRGQVLTSESVPAAGAWVFAYRSARSGLRGPADFAAEVETDGSYFLDLVEGTYHLVARWSREGDTVAGPPRRGDAWAPYKNNPVRVEPGETSTADFRLVGVAQPMVLRQGTLVSGDTGFTGRLVDERGQPVAGAVVLAYRSADFHRMPDYTAPAADDEGRFTLYLPAAGRYCLVMRARPRGQPRAGELYARIGSERLACPAADAGEIRNLGTVVLKPYRR